MGEIWIGEDRRLRMKVAMKTLLPSSLEVPEMVLRFKREAELLVTLRSDRVARLIDFIEEEPYGPVLVMEYVEGQSLAAKFEEGRLSVEETIDLGIDVLHALRELHRCRIVHRDVKPGNILLQPLADGTARAVIVDFGVSRFLGDSAADDADVAITRHHTAVGTIAYMPPEQIVDSRLVTENADLYALASVLFRAVTGHVPFRDLYGIDLVNAKLMTAAPALVPPMG